MNLAPVKLERAIVRLEVPTGKAGYEDAERGTGVFISPTQVLTALHVLTGPLDKLPETGSTAKGLQARVCVGDRKVRLTVVWPNEVSSASLDAAVLSLDEEQDPAEDWIPLGLRPWPQAGPYRSIAWPEKSHESIALSGKCLGRSKIKPRFWVITQGGDRPIAKQAWGGASGAPVVVGGEVIGLVVDHAGVDFAHELLAVDLETIWSAQGFLQIEPQIRGPALGKEFVLACRRALKPLSDLSKSFKDDDLLNADLVELLKRVSDCLLPGLKDESLSRRESQACIDLGLTLVGWRGGLEAVAVLEEHAEQFLVVDAQTDSGLEMVAARRMRINGSETPRAARFEPVSLLKEKPKGANVLPEVEIGPSPKARNKSLHDGLRELVGLDHDASDEAVNEQIATYRDLFEHGGFDVYLHCLPGESHYEKAPDAGDILSFLSELERYPDLLALQQAAGVGGGREVRIITILNAMRLAHERAFPLEGESP